MSYLVATIAFVKNSTYDEFCAGVINLGKSGTQPEEDRGLLSLRTLGDSLVGCVGPKVRKYER